MTERKVLTELGVVLSKENIGELWKKQCSDSFCEEYFPIANSIAKPKAILAWADVTIPDDHRVQIEDEVFDSILLVDKLKGLHRVLLYVVTAGNEIKECEDIDEPVFADMLSGMVLINAMGKLYEYINNELGMSGLAALNPGSLPDWPIENNHKLCNIIGNVGEIGVSLNEAGYMTPWNSSSGILFTGEDGYQNCSLCKNLDCIGRRAKFNQEEYDRIFG